MLQGVNRIFPSQIVAVRLCHHIGIATTTGIGNQGFVNLVNLVVLLRGGKLTGHLLEHLITLGILSE